MSIYGSSKVLPYVYILTHKNTNQFYFGYRKANKIPSDKDLPIYQSSSKHIRGLKFENFDWTILAEFFDVDSAYDFEQSLIFEHLKNPLCLNKSCFENGKQHFKRTGPLSEEHKQKIKDRLHDPIVNAKLKSKLGCVVSVETKLKMSISSKASRTPEVLKKISDAQRGRKLTNDHKQKLSIAAIKQFSDPLQRQKSSDAAFNRAAMTEETKLKMKQSSKNRNLTPELREKFKTATKTWTGRKHSLETIAKMKASHAKRKITDTVGLQ